MPPLAAASAHHAPDDAPMVIIAGHHRSGTGLLAKRFAAAGLHLDDDAGRADHEGARGLLRSSAPQAADADPDAAAIHRRLLADNGRTWQLLDDLLPVVHDDVWHDMAELIVRRRAEGRPWGFAGPAVCPFLPLWKHVAPDARIVMTVRPPAPSVESLERLAARHLLEGRQVSHGHAKLWTDEDHGLRLWVAANRALLRTAEAHPEDVVLVRFDDLVAGRDVVGEIDRRWRLGLDEIAPPSGADVADRTGAELGRSPSVTVRSPELLTEVESLWHRLGSLAGRSMAPVAAS